MKNIIIISCFLFSFLIEKTNANNTVDSTLIGTIINDFIQKSNLPGVSIAVSQKGEIVYANGFGYANVEDKIKMTPSTQLRTASVAKVITATAIGKLVSDGKLDLDAPIQNYVPYIQAQYANLTTRQLAGHTAGLQHQPSAGVNKKKQYTSVQKTLEFINDPLLFEPDTDYKYSTMAFNLLAAVIEGASGLTYLKYLEKAIFQPLNMQQTMPENIDALTENDAQIYYLKKNKLRCEKLTNGSYKLAGAGFRSTPTDLVKMMNAYQNGLISKAVVAEMFASHQLKNGDKTNVGIVWRTSFDAFGNRTIEHAGNWRGARTVVVHYLEKSMTIAVMINAGRGIAIEEMAHILAALFNEKTAKFNVGNVDNQAIELVFKNNRKVTKHQGNFSIKNKKGELTSNSDSFFKNMSLHYLGQGNHFAAVTKYGLLYVNLAQKPSLQGELYFYGTMNKAKPTEGETMLTFKAMK